MSWRAGFFIILYFCAACGKEMPQNPVNFTDIPQKVEPVGVTYKSMFCVAGYRVETSKYILTTVHDCILGAESRAFGGPATIDMEKWALFRSHMEEAIKSGGCVDFFGGAVGEYGGRTYVVLWMYRFKGKKYQLHGDYDWGDCDTPPK